MITTTYRTTKEELDKRMREETEYGVLPFERASQNIYMGGTLMLGDDWHSNSDHYHELVVGEHEFFIREYRRSGRNTYFEPEGEDMPFLDFDTALKAYVLFSDQDFREYEEHRQYAARIADDG